jgi:hypothetical protein
MMWKGKFTSESFPVYDTHHVKAMFQPPLCGQYNPGDTMVDTLLIRDELINEDVDDENLADCGAQSGQT